MRDSTNTILAIIFSLALVIFTIEIFVIMDLERQLDDCQFEVNHLQVRLYRLQELTDYVPAMEQLLPPLAAARLKTATEMIRQKRHREYERYEQPLIEEVKWKFLKQ